MPYPFRDLRLALVLGMSITSHQEATSVFLCLYLCLCLQEEEKKFSASFATAELFLSLTCAPVRVEVYLASRYSGSLTRTRPER